MTTDQNWAEFERCSRRAGEELAQAAWIVSELAEGSVLDAFASLQTVGGEVQTIVYPVSGAEVVQRARKELWERREELQEFTLAVETFARFPDTEGKHDAIAIDAWCTGMAGPITVVQRFRPLISGEFHLLGDPLIVQGSKVLDEPTRGRVAHCVMEGFDQHHQAAALRAKWERTEITTPEVTASGSESPLARIVGPALPGKANVIEDWGNKLRFARVEEPQLGQLVAGTVNLLTLVKDGEKAVGGVFSVESIKRIVARNGATRITLTDMLDQQWITIAVKDGERVEKLIDEFLARAPNAPFEKKAPEIGFFSALKRGFAPSLVLIAICIAISLYWPWVGRVLFVVVIVAWASTLTKKGRQDFREVTWETKRWE